MNIKKSIFALVMAAAILCGLLPLSVSAASCNHVYGGTLWCDAAHPHAQFYYCEYNCGTRYYTGTYTTKSNCSTCNPSIGGSCTHSSTWLDGAHPHQLICRLCAAVLGTQTSPTCPQCCVHAYGYSFVEADHQYGGYHNSYFYCYSCLQTFFLGQVPYLDSCTICHPPVVSTVSLSASGPSGTIYSSGIIEATGVPASFSVSASCQNCYVTSMYYYHNGQMYSSTGSSISFTASTMSDFGDITVYVQTSTGLTDSISVNFKFAKYQEAAIMWDYGDQAIIRTITCDGQVIRSGLSSAVDFNWVNQGLTDAAYDQVASLVGRYDGKTYILTGSSIIRVYTPTTGQTLATFDTYSDFDALCNYAYWSQGTLNAFESARTTTISYQAPKAIEGEAIWQTVSGQTLHTVTAADAAGKPYIKPNESITVGFQASDYTPTGYIYKGMRWSYGTNTGESTTQNNFSSVYNYTSPPIHVTFLYDVAPTVGSVQINVYDHDTLTRIPDATISFEGQTSTSNPVTYKNLPFKMYSASAGAPGYASGSGAVTISATKPDGIIDIQLIRNAGDLTIIVLDETTNLPISGASITGSGSGTTDSSGRCVIRNLPFTGTHTFTASASGYYPNSGTATLSRANPTGTLTIYLKPMPKTGSITVSVYDAVTQLPIGGASVSGAGRSGMTNGAGNVTFADVLYGNYTFNAAADGYFPGSGSGTISLEQQHGSVAIYLQPIPTHGNITVCVRDAKTNAIIPGASVSGGGLGGTTNGSGLVSFPGALLGSYTFTASKANYWSNSGNIAIDIYNPNATLTIYLTPHPTHGDITVLVKDKATGAPLPGAVVSGPGLSGTTDASGSAVFRPVPLGSYPLTATLRGYTPGSATAQLTIYDTSSVVTIYLEQRKADVSIEANEIDGTIYRGSTIIVSANLGGDSFYDFTPANPLTVTMEAHRNGGQVFDSQSTSMICPAGGSNLVWFVVDIPETGYSLADVTFDFHVSLPPDILGENFGDDVTTKRETTVVLPTRSTPDPTLELTAPGGFSNSPYTGRSAPTKSWSVWEWEGGFVHRTYSAKLELTASLVPDATAGWSELRGHDWATRSGYGLNTTATLTVNGAVDMIAGKGKVNAYFPEFGYSTAANQSKMLTGDGTYTFPANADTISGSPMHMTPVWFPDGTYSVKYTAYDIWTPAGMLTANTYAQVTIEGSMYDDYYTQRN